MTPSPNPLGIPPPWYRVEEHADCGRLCPCARRALREAREDRHGAEHPEAWDALCALLGWAVVALAALLLFARLVGTP